jgi:hypothetical protein
MNRYQWIIDRARGGEPVAINTDRPDMARIIDFLFHVEGDGLTIQVDNEHNLLWVVQSEALHHA